MTSASSRSSSDFMGKDIFSVMYVSVDRPFSEGPVSVVGMHLMIFDTLDNAVLVFKLPNNLVVDIPGRFGEEPLSKVVALGALASNGDILGGVSLAKKVLQKLFAFSIDGYIVSGPALESVFRKTLFEGNSLGFIDLNAFKEVLSGEQLETNLTLRDLYELSILVSAASPNGLVNKEVSKSYFADTTLVDAFLGDLVFDSAICAENKSVAVLNGTGIPGMAEFGGRVVVNAGGRVIAKENASRSYEKSLLVVDDPFSETVDYISDFWGISTIVLKSESSGIEEPVLDRADVVLIIGLDTVDVL